MRNKGFFWGLTGILVAICIYQLSFTFITNSQENKAEKQAQRLANELKETAKLTGDSALLPNNTWANFKDADGLDIAKAAFVNDILSKKVDKNIFLGNNFQALKSKSLAFGLDLVGGMSVTLEISVPELILSKANDKNSLYFKEPYNKAFAAYTNRGGDFIDLFFKEYEAKNKSRMLAKDVRVFEMTGLSLKSSNSEIKDYLKKEVGDAVVGVEQIMAKRINQFGVAQPNIQREVGTNRIFIELPGVQDEETMAQKLKSTANLEFYEIENPQVWSPIVTQIDNISKFTEVKSVAQETIIVNDSLKDTTVKVAPMVQGAKTEAKSNFLSLCSFQPQGCYFILKEEDKSKVQAILNRDDVKRILPSSLKLLFSAKAESFQKGKPRFYFLHPLHVPTSGIADVSGKQITESYSSYNPASKKNEVILNFDVDGAQRWATMTERVATKLQQGYNFLAITMDDVVYSAPSVDQAIRGGNTSISGSFSTAEAADLSGLLNAGSLPAPCVIKNQTKVGPTIGADNRSAGLISFAIAFLAVFIYMYWYYGKGGLIADIALAVNVILIFGTLASFGAVLTLAGIAGIVLTIGTAVDANILIFERIKEEEAVGKSQNEAIEIGFKKALPAIIDANVTHILVAIILKIFGTGEVESFATTLIIGIFTSLFTALIVTKMIIYWNLERGKHISFSTKTTKSMFQNFKFDWLGKRKYYYIFSIAVTIFGIIALFTRGLSPSVEFTGGRAFTAQIDKAISPEEITVALQKVLINKNGEPANVEVKTKSSDRNIDIVTNYLRSDESATEIVKSKVEEGLKSISNKIGSAKIIETKSVTASVSSEMWTSSFWAILLSLVVIFAYIFIRFGQWQYSLGAIIGLIHDAFFVISIFALLHGFLPFSLDVNQAFIAAILTVIGYSMNDTIIVFDRIRENLSFNQEKADKEEIINSALNKTLSRTFNTSMILFVVLLIMFLFGGPAIKGFLFALLIGVIIGTYSSLCVATPILIDFTSRFRNSKSKKVTEAIASESK